MSSGRRKFDPWPPLPPSEPYLPTMAEVAKHLPTMCALCRQPLAPFVGAFEHDCRTGECVITDEQGNTWTWTWAAR